jgi:putative acetyltransferase
MIELRAIAIEDAGDVHRICAHPEVARTLGGLPSDGLDGWKKRILELPIERTTLLGAFEDGALRGVAQLQGLPRARQRHVAKIWVAVDPMAHRRGIGRRLVGALCDAADRWWSFVRLELDVHDDHTPAISLYRAAGFDVEVRKRCDMLRDGVMVDGLHMARIRPGYVPPPPIGDPPPIPARGTRLDRKRIQIRPARPDDGAGMAELHGSESVMEGTFATPYQTEREWRNRLATNDANVRALVAVVAGRVVASCALFGNPSPRLAHAVGLGIAVHPDHQGCGVGDALMGAVIDLADRWMGIRRVQLEVYDDNARAQALYRKHGFEPEGAQRLVSFRRGTYCDAVVMSRIRSSPPSQRPE